MTWRRYFIICLLPITLFLFMQFSRLLKLTSSFEAATDEIDAPLHGGRQIKFNANKTSRTARKGQNPNGTSISAKNRMNEAQSLSLRLRMQQNEMSTANVSNQSKADDAKDGPPPGSCLALKEHEKGHWIHVRLDNSSVVLEHKQIYKQHYPRELNWMKGIELPPNFNKHQCNGANPGEYYITGLGNQCGCDASGFHPSYSSWVYNKTEHGTYSTENGVLRLANRLIKTNSTLCFAGDSIDLQIYQSIQRQLERLQGLRQCHFNTPLNVSFELREVPINYSRPCGKLHAGLRPCGFAAMKNLKETVLTHRDYIENVGLVRYIKFYGWSPVSPLLIYRLKRFISST